MDHENSSQHTQSRRAGNSNCTRTGLSERQQTHRFKGWRKTLTSIHAHCQWIALYLNSPDRSKRLLISQSQPFALACVTADLADPLQKINTDLLRPALLYHLHLPQLTTDPDSPDRYGDVSLNAADHNVPHNLVRDAHFVTAVSAYGSNCVELEPTEHSTYSPGKRPDIYLPEVATIVDAKVGRLNKTSAPAATQSRATHTAFAANEDDFFAISLGRSQRGTKGDGPFDPTDASGYVPAVRGEYASALGKGQVVIVALSEITGATHPNTRIFQRNCATAHTARQGTPAALDFLKRDSYCV